MVERPPLVERNGLGGLVVRVTCGSTSGMTGGHRLRGGIAIPVTRAIALATRVAALL